MINPVLRREAKTTLRNWKIFYAVAGYVLIVTIVAAIAIWQLMYNSYNDKRIYRTYGFTACSCSSYDACVYGRKHKWGKRETDIGFTFSDENVTAFYCYR